MTASVRSSTGSEARPPRTWWRTRYFRSCSHVLHVDNLGFGELSRYSGGPFRGTWTRRVDTFAQQGYRLTNYAPEAQCTPTRSARMTGWHAIRSGTACYRELPLAAGSWPGSETLGDLLDDARYACAVYGKWHVGERDGRWPTDHGFAEWYLREWYGPPCTYGKALLPTDPWYELPSETDCRGWSRAHADEPDVAERDQLTLEVRRDCDVDYLRRASAFMGDAADHETPFFVYFNHSLAFKGRTGTGRLARQLCSSWIPTSARCWTCSRHSVLPTTRSSPPGSE